MRVHISVDVWHDTFDVTLDGTGKLRSQLDELVDEAVRRVKRAYQAEPVEELGDHGTE